VIVGRTKEDNRQILKLMDPKKDIALRMADMASPTVLIPGAATDEMIHQAATLCVSYSKAQDGAPARVSVKSPDGSKILTVQGGDREIYYQHLI
jgi:predicted ribosome quality control (RQC) complex YloA/Tae2 family protein